MTLRKPLWIAALAGLALVLGVVWWYFRHAPTQRPASDGPREAAAATPARPDGAPRASTAAVDDEPRSQARSRLRKCLGGGKVLYTNDDCPKGTSERTVDGGSLTVVDGQRAPGAPPDAAGALPHARDILAPPGGVDIKAERIERVIDR